MKISCMDALHPDALEQEVMDNNPCPYCGSDNLAIQRVSTKSWRGWPVECLDCGEVAEYDDYEPPAEHRSA